MAGSHAVGANTLTLEDVEALPEDYKSPMTSAISFEPTSFSLTAAEAPDDGCALLAGTTVAQPETRAFSEFSNVVSLA